MKSIPVSKASLANVFDAVVESRQPLRLTSHSSSAVVIGWEQWRAIEETLHRLTAPAFRPATSARRAHHGEHFRA